MIPWLTRALLVAWSIAHAYQMVRIAASGASCTTDAQGWAERVGEYGAGPALTWMIGCAMDTTGSVFGRGGPF